MEKLEARAMGLPEAWEGDPKAIGRFLRFFHRQLQQIDFGVPEGEFTMRMRELQSECERAMLFAEGYAAAKPGKRPLMTVDRPVTPQPNMNEPAQD